MATAALLFSKAFVFIRRALRRNLTLRTPSVKTYQCVLTGGPCGGKSSTLSPLKEALEMKGYKVFIVPEVSLKILKFQRYLNIYA